jgi:hypothetical protein
LNDAGTTTEDQLERKMEDLFQKLLAHKETTIENLEKNQSSKNSANSPDEQEEAFVTDLELCLHLQAHNVPDPDKDYLRLLHNMHYCSRQLDLQILETDQGHEFHNSLRTSSIYIRSL